MNLCVNCIWYRPISLFSGIIHANSSSAECAHPKALKLSRVTGETTFPTCSSQRSIYGKCKEEGLLYEESEWFRND